MQRRCIKIHEETEEKGLHLSFGQHQQFRQSNIALVILPLKGCAEQRDLLKGNKLHADILKCGLFGRHISIGNTLINLYAKCGVLSKAQQLFDELPLRDVVSWNSLITGFAHHGYADEAFRCFERMYSESLSPNSVTYLGILKACGIKGSAEKGNEIHVEMVRKGLHGGDILLGTALLDMYAKCGALARAREVFDELRVQNVISWTTLATGYAQNGHAEQAIVCFEEMQEKGISPSACTFACILKACGSIKAADKGAEIHDSIKRNGFLRGNSVLGTAAVDMYAKCGLLTKAREVFDELSTRDIISWNALIAGYCEQGPFEEAFKCLEQVKAEKLLPDAVTFTCILKACGSLRTAEKGQELHSEIVRRDLLKKNCVLGTALMDMYAKCGATLTAREVFDNLPARDVACWNALLVAYCEDGRGENALNCFQQMRSEGMSPDEATFASVLKACGIAGAVERGEEIHSEIVRGGFLVKEGVLGSAIVDMYARCGAFEKAQQVFDKLSVRDVMSWTALIAGYAHVGKHNLVFHLFTKMIAEGMEPSLVTFFVLLNACSYLGFVNEGKMYFEWISSRYGMIPRLEHQSCMVDLLSRAGYFEEAIKLINKVPSIDNLPSWLSLLGACRMCSNVKFGRLSFHSAVRLDKRCAVAYMCMRDIYVSAGMQSEADKIEVLRKENGGLLLICRQL